jgi:HAD superfamily hydrolase (TIGR01549 family)
MLKAVLFDLDDTLLGNHMDTFIPRYFSLLGKYAEAHLPRDEFLQVLLVATQMMASNTDPAQTNREVFWHSFTSQTGLNAKEMEPFFDKFYQNEFMAMESVVTRRETAVSLVRLCQQKGCKIVIATNPMFPRTAVEARLRWAGLPVTEFDFDLVTTYEMMHATKPHPAYYEEIMTHIGVAADEVLMVGDDWENDIAPAASIGCFTYWLPMNGEPGPPDTDLVTKYGTLAELYDLVNSCWLTELVAS